MGVRMRKTYRQHTEEKTTAEKSLGYDENVNDDRDTHNSHI